MKKYLIWFLLWIIFVISVFFVAKALDIWTVSSWGQLLATKMNDIIGKINWLDYNSWNSVLTVNGVVKYSNSNLTCNSWNNWIIKYSWDNNFYGCNGTDWLTVFTWSSSSSVPQTCLEIKNTVWWISWIYWIDPSWWDSTDKFQVYCDMTTNWWWRTYVVWINWSNGNHKNTSSVTSWNLIVDWWYWKYSDSVINQIQWLWNNQILFKCLSYSITFSSCTFWATNPITTAWNCVNSWTPDWAWRMYWLSAFTDWWYARSTWNGCAAYGSAWAQNWSVRVR